MEQVTVDGIVTDEHQENYVVLLKTENDEGVLPLRINQEAAASIAIEMDEQETPRPGTHELMVDFFDDLDVSVAKVKIEPGNDDSINTVIELTCAQQQRQSYDSRPSDALALAVRTEAPINVSEELLEKSDDVIQKRTRNSHPSDEVTKLQYKLEEAVGNENYERAAELKGEIKTALRRHEESVENLDEDIEDALEDAM